MLTVSTDIDSSLGHRGEVLSPSREVSGGTGEVDKEGRIYT